MRSRCLRHCKIYIYLYTLRSSAWRWF